MRKINTPTCLLVLLSAGALVAAAQDMAAIQQKLVSEYALTQPTAAMDDIVTPGAVLVLKKGPLMMVDASNSVNPFPTTYKDGKMKNATGKAHSFLGAMSTVPGFGSVPGSSQASGGPGTRTFVPGEKIWVTGIEVRQNGVVFNLFTDAYNNVRYKTSLTFAFPKGGVPPADAVDKLVAEVFSVQPADNNADGNGQQQGAAGGQQGAPGQQAAPPRQQTSPGVQPVNAQAVQSAPQQPQQQEAAPPPIAPPPPPPADPKTIALKQTQEEVAANFGQPEKKIKLASKEIWVYKDMKVTFVNGKVTDVQ